MKKTIILSTLAAIITPEFLDKYPDVEPITSGTLEGQTGEGVTELLSKAFSVHAKGFARWLAINEYRPVTNNWQLVNPHWFKLSEPAVNRSIDELFNLYLEDVESGRFK